MFSELICECSDQSLRYSPRAILFRLRKDQRDYGSLSSGGVSKLCPTRLVGVPVLRLATDVRFVRHDVATH